MLTANFNQSKTMYNKIIISWKHCSTETHIKQEVYLVPVYQLGLFYMTLMDLTSLLQPR